MVSLMCSSGLRSQSRIRPASLALSSSLSPASNRLSLDRPNQLESTTGGDTHPVILHDCRMCPAMCSAPRCNACRDGERCVDLDYAAPSDIQFAGQGIAAECVVHTLDHGRVQECREDSTMHYPVVALMSVRDLSMTSCLDPARFELQMQTLLAARSTRKTFRVKIVRAAIFTRSVTLTESFHCQHPRRLTSSAMIKPKPHMFMRPTTIPAPSRGGPTSPSRLLGPPSLFTPGTVFLFSRTCGELPTPATIPALEFERLPHPVISSFDANCLTVHNRINQRLTRFLNNPPKCCTRDFHLRRCFFMRERLQVSQPESFKLVNREDDFIEQGHGNALGFKVCKPWSMRYAT